MWRQGNPIPAGKNRSGKNDARYGAQIPTHNARPDKALKVALRIAEKHRTKVLAEVAAAERRAQMDAAINAAMGLLLGAIQHGARSRLDGDA